MKRLSVLLIVLLWIAVPSGSVAAGEPTGLEIVTRWDGRPRERDLVTKARFILINRRGQKRIRETRRYRLDMEGKKGFDEKTIIFFDKPSDVKGTSLLNWSYTDAKRDDDQWLYLPALRKVKRISSADKEKSFMGSDLTFEDMGDRKVEEDRHRLLGVEEFKGRECYVVEMVPREKNHMYSRKVKWIDKTEFIDYRTDFYDRKGRFLKRLIVEWKKIDDIWVISRMEVKNEQTGHMTVVEITNTEINTGLKERLFTKRRMESGR